MIFGLMSVLRLILHLNLKTSPPAMPTRPTSPYVVFLFYANVTHLLEYSVCESMELFKAVVKL